MAQFSPFEVGQVKAHMHHGLGAPRTAGIIFKADGKTRFSTSAVQGCMDKLLANPRWRGEREKGSGPPRKTTKKQDAALVKYVLANRGKRKVTVPHLRTQFPFLKGLSNTLVEERLKAQAQAPAVGKESGSQRPVSGPGRGSSQRQRTADVNKHFRSAGDVSNGQRPRPGGGNNAAVLTRNLRVRGPCALHTHISKVGVAGPFRAISFVFLPSRRPLRSGTTLHARQRGSQASVVKSLACQAQRASRNKRVHLAGARECQAKPLPSTLPLRFT